MKTTSGNFRIGIIGCGYWGPNLIRNFSSVKGSQVKYICDLDAERLAVVHEQFPACQPTTDYKTLLADPELDAVAIATPVFAHHRLAIDALNAGKHVFIEKPLASSVAEAEEIVALAREKGLVLQVDHTFVYTSAVQKIKELVDSGELGDLLYFDSVRVNLGLFQSDINVIWDLAPHDFSIMDYVFAQKPVAISAQGRAHFGMKFEDIAYVTAYFDTDTIAHFHVNWLSPVKIRQVLLGGSRKMLVWDDMDVSEPVKVYDRGVELGEGKGGLYNALVQYRLGDMHAPRLAAREALRLEAQHFKECVEQGKSPTTDGEMGLRVVKLLEATQKSLENGGQKIPIT
ncbi:MAG: Gfo/Idh/MocA family oxidoreductase [Candidatus Sumerlaeaceae bacterium]|nr:Gfo/Idh/MocA family oxidoreductase [Candidatus Sumerlaeaceae bacterium]